MEVWFRCDSKNKKMFILNVLKELDSVPMIGDIIEPSQDAFMKATYRVKPFDGNIKNIIHINFRVIKRTYKMYDNVWELICEPTPESLLFLLESIRSK